MNEPTIYDLEEEELAFVMHNRGYCGGRCPYCEEEWHYRQWTRRWEEEDGTS